MKNDCTTELIKHGFHPDEIEYDEYFGKIVILKEKVICIDEDEDKIIW